MLLKISLMFFAFCLAIVAIRRQDNTTNSKTPQSPVDPNKVIEDIFGKKKEE